MKSVSEQRAEEFCLELIKSAKTKSVDSFNASEQEKLLLTIENCFENGIFVHVVRTFCSKNKFSAKEVKFRPSLRLLTYTKLALMLASWIIRR